MHRCKNVPTKNCLPKYKKTRQKSSLKRVNCHHLKKTRRKSSSKNASIAIVWKKRVKNHAKMNCVNCHWKPKMRQWSSQKTALKVMLERTCVKNHPASQFPCVNIPASKATPLSSNLKVPASEFIALKIVCVKGPGPLLDTSTRYLQVS